MQDKTSMEHISYLLSLLLIWITASSFVQGETDSSSDQCPTWFFYNSTSKQCECFSSLDTDAIVKCTNHEREILLRIGFCMTYDEGDGFHVGPCSYFDLSQYNRSANYYNYISLPSNTSELENYMCGPLNRKGIMCSQCIDGYGPSYTVGYGTPGVLYTCEKCSQWNYGLPLYLLLELVQIVVVYCVVLFLRLYLISELTSGPSVAFVLYCQIQEFLFLTVSNSIPDSKIIQLWRLLMIFYSIFNLDSCRFIIPVFCASPNLKPFHINFLSYIPFIYLLCSIALSWACIKLYSNEFRLAVWLWNKLNQLILKYINLNWDRMIDAFSTLFLLSYTKLVYASIFTTIRPTAIWKVNNFSVQLHLGQYSDPNIEYYGREHLPYVIVSSIVILFFVLPLPIFLALYPFRSFRSLLFKCRLISHHMGVINTFLDKFYSYYRDGLNGGRDMRSLVSLYYFVYCLAFGLVVVEVLLNLYLNIGVIVFAVFGFLVATIQPYKSTFVNVTDTLILANLTLFYLFLGECARQEKESSSHCCWIVTSIFNMILPLLGVVSYIVFRAIKKLSCCQKNNNTRDGPNIEEIQHIMSLDTDDAPEVPDHLQQEQQNLENSYGSFEGSIIV